MIRSMNTAGHWANEFRQLVRVRRFQLAETAVLKNQLRQLVIFSQFLENVFSCGGLPLGRFADDRQVQFFKQHLLNLPWGGDIKGNARRRVRLLLYLCNSFAQFDAVVR